MKFQGLDLDSSQPFFHMIRSRAVANNEYLWDNPQKFPEMEKIIIASDSFKGSLSPEEVSDAAAMAIHEVFPDCTVEKIPVADGGEGTSEALMKILGGEMVHLTVHDPLMRPVHASYGITVDGHTAIIDMAQASGLDLLSKEERNPMEATSFGTGEIIADAIRMGRRTRRVVWENVVLALGTKLLVLLLGFCGVATLWEAVFADVGVALLAVLNTMKLRIHHED